MKELSALQLEEINGGAFFLVPVAKFVFYAGSGAMGAYTLGEAVGSWV